MTDSLLSRLENEEPSRELADEVLLAFGWEIKHTPTRKERFWRDPSTGVTLYDDQRPNTLTDMNAAMALVPEGMEWEMSNMYGIARVTLGLNADEQYFGECKFWETNISGFATALTIAAYKAIKERENGS